MGKDQRGPRPAGRWRRWLAPGILMVAAAGLAQWWLTHGASNSTINQAKAAAPQSLPGSEAVAASAAATQVGRAASAGGQPTSRRFPSNDVERLRALEEAGEIPQLDRSDSLQGPDADGNGVRDDIDAWIVRKLPEGQQRQAARQFARHLQATVLVDVDDPVAVRRLADAGMHATSCLFDAWPHTDTSAPSRWSDQLQAMTSSTKQRLQARVAFSRALHGTVLRLPMEPRCD